MKTVVHAFNFDTEKPEGKAGYDALKAKLAGYPHKMRSLTSGRSYYETGKMLDSKTIELETAHLFENQWNTAPIPGVNDKGLRVFDWAEDAIFDHYGHERKNLRCGYYLEQTAEMRDIRRNTSACGYCGKQEPAAKGSVFCPHCIVSEYLKEEDLHLTRMMSVDTPFGEKRAPLTEAEAAHLVPLFREAQFRGTTARITKKRADLAARFAKVTANAKMEFDGFTWLMDHEINIDNVIFYGHTGRFGFGWREPVSADFCTRLLGVISEFPFPYDIKCADGRTLSGG